MKKTLSTILAAAAVFSAAAQSPVASSNVNGRKLNFEAPLFGLTVKNVKPTWSLVAFPEADLGYSHALNVPKQYAYAEGTTVTGETVSYTQSEIGLRPGGLRGDLSLLELRLRPWRDGNLFFWGLNLGIETHWLRDRCLFDKNNLPVRAAYTGIARGSYSERFISLAVGYSREYGDWSFGVQLLPGWGYSLYRNAYRTYQPLLASEDLVLHLDGKFAIRQDNAIGSIGFRFGARAAVWYRSFGAFVSVQPGHTAKGPEYTTLSAGLSVRY